MEDFDSVETRLISEVRQITTLLEEVKQILLTADYDFHLLTVQGALKKLIRDKTEALERVRKLEKELDSLVRKKK